MPLENKASHGDFSTEMALCCLLEEVVPDRLASREIRCSEALRTETRNSTRQIYSSTTEIT